MWGKQPNYVRASAPEKALLLWVRKGKKRVVEFSSERSSLTACLQRPIINEHKNKRPVNCTQIRFRSLETSRLNTSGNILIFRKHSYTASDNSSRYDRRHLYHTHPQEQSKTSQLHFLHDWCLMWCRVKLSLSITLAILHPSFLHSRTIEVQFYLIKFKAEASEGMGELHNLWHLYRKNGITFRIHCFFNTLLLQVALWKMINTLELPKVFGVFQKKQEQNSNCKCLDEKKHRPPTRIWKWTNCGLKSVKNESNNRRHMHVCKQTPSRNSSSNGKRRSWTKIRPKSFTHSIYGVSFVKTIWYFIHMTQFQHSPLNQTIYLFTEMCLEVSRVP